MKNYQTEHYFYYQLIRTKEKINKKIFIARAVIENFGEKQKDGTQIRHIDCDKTNNCAPNLRMGKHRDGRTIMSDIEVMNMYLDGIKIAEIAKRCECSKQTIYNKLNILKEDFDIPRRGKGKRCKDKPKRDTLICRLLESGKTYDEVAKQFSLSKSTIWAIYNKMGKIPEENRSHRKKVEQIIRNNENKTLKEIQESLSSFEINMNIRAIYAQCLRKNINFKKIKKGTKYYESKI